MAAETPNKRRILSDTLAQILSSGIRAGTDVVAYINSTYDYPSIDEIRTIIERRDGSDSESLVELIFFPDHSIQLQLEKVLEKHTYTPDDVAAVAADLAGRNIMARIALVESGRMLHLLVDRSIIDPFLSRLNMTYALDADLCRTIEEVVPKDVQRAVRIRLRNAQARPSGHKRDFVARYLRAVGDDPFIFEGLDFLLEFIREIGPDADIYEAMMRKKRRCWQHLNRYVEIEGKLSGSNMEIQLLRGERFPHIDRERMLKTISTIDRICLAVFGKTETIAAASDSADSLQIDDEMDAAALIRRLCS